MKPFPVFTVANAIVVLVFLSLAPWYAALPSLGAFTYFCWNHQ